MSDALLARIATLQGEVAALKAEAKGHRLKARRRREEQADLARQLEGARGELRRLAAERDDLTARLDADPGEWRERYEAAARDLRGLKHAAHWAQVIGGDLAEKVPVAKVWEQVGYQPGDELPDPDQIRQWATAARDAAPYLFRPRGAGEPPAGPDAGLGGPQPPDAPPTPPTQYQVGVFDGGGRGRRDVGTDRLVVTRSQMQDPGFMLRHTRALAAASAAGTLTIRDE
ncbi:MAG: hypothetical protein JO329_00050 [Planctomycetaceae bacterium]|nr:hypothetical protein [Planctomycetaceae bacterium]